MIISIIWAQFELEIELESWTMLEQATTKARSRLFHVFTQVFCSPEYAVTNTIKFDPNENDLTSREHIFEFPSKE